LDVALTEPEIGLLRSIVEQMAHVLETPEQIPRLLPPAYSDDEEAQAEYARLMTDELVDGKRRALASMEATLERGAKRLTQEEAEDWLAVLNDARLTLGTRLDVTEETYDKDIDPADSEAAALEVFRYLGYLEEWLVESLMG